MRDLRFMIFLLSPFLFLGAACTSTQTTTIGNHTPRQTDCAVDFVRLNMMDYETMQSYEIVGTVGVGSLRDLPPNWTDELRHEIRPKICLLGGDTASLSATTTSENGVGSSMAILGLKRKPEADVFGSAAYLERRIPELRKKAAFDLNCIEPDLAISDLGGTSRGVRGCGRQATYSYVRSGMNTGVWQREAQ